MNIPFKPRWIVAIAAFAIACSVAPRAGAQHNRNASLNWVRAAEADGCTSARGVAQRVESYFRSENLLDEESFTFVPSGSGHIAIEGYVSTFRDGFQVVIGVSHDDSKLDGVEFVQRARNCADLEVQAALVIAQLLDCPELGLARTESPQPAPKPIAARPLMRMADSAVAPSRAKQTRSRGDDGGLPLKLLLGGTLDRGVFPHTGWGGAIGLQAEPPGLFVMELDFAYQTSSEAVQYADGQVGIPNSAAASQRGGRVALRGCPASFRREVLGILGCAGLGYSAVLTELQSFRTDDRAWVSWLGIEVSVRPTLQVTPWLHLWLDAAASLSIIRSSPFIAELSSESDSPRLTLYSAPQQSSRLTLGFAYSL